MKVQTKSIDVRNVAGQFKARSYGKNMMLYSKTSVHQCLTYAKALERIPISTLAY